jgi:replication-associated recombination protein RarA
MDKIWYEELGFKENPLTIRPKDNLIVHVGQEEIIKEMNKIIPKKAMIHLYGKYGTGKTTILQGIIRKYAGKRKVIYYNCNETQEMINIRKLVSGAGTTLQKLFGKKPKDLIILLDEAQHIGIKDIDSIIKYYNDGVFKAVIFASPDKKDIKIKKVKMNYFSLLPLKSEQAEKLIKKRLGNFKLIPSILVKDILKLDNRQRQFLMNCEELAQIAVSDGRKQINKDDILTLKNKYISPKIK